MALYLRDAETGSEWAHDPSVRDGRGPEYIKVEHDEKVKPVRVAGFARALPEPEEDED